MGRSSKLVNVYICTTCGLLTKPGAVGRCTAHRHKVEGFQVRREDIVLTDDDKHLMELIKESSEQAKEMLASLMEEKTSPTPMRASVRALSMKPGI